MYKYDFKKKCFGGYFGKKHHRGYGRKNWFKAYICKPVYVCRPEPQHYVCAPNYKGCYFPTYW